MEKREICISEYIESELHSQGKTITWLARKIKINNKTLSGKLKRNSLKAEELLEIASVLNIDLNKLKKSHCITNYEALVQLAKYMRDPDMKFGKIENHLCREDKFLSKEDLNNLYERFKDEEDILVETAKFLCEHSSSEIIEGIYTARAFIKTKYQYK